MGLNVATTPAPHILAQSAVPVILAPNGTVATNGTITLGTALPTIYSGGAWVRLPAGAVVGGLAGLYWTVFSSTTVGAVKTLFVDPATAFTPYVPTVALVAATGSNAAYTQTTAADITLANVTVPGGVMGLSGGLRRETVHSWNNSAGLKSATEKFSAETVGAISGTTTVSGHSFATTRNRGLSNLQVSPMASAIGASSSAAHFTTVNTDINQSLIFTGQLAVATDFLVLEYITVEVHPS